MVKNDYFHSKIHIYVIVNIILNMFMKKKKMQYCIIPALELGRIFYHQW